MKWSTTPVSKLSFAARACLVAASILTLTAAPFGPSTRVAADKYDDQIAAIQQQINGYNASADTLAKQADSLQTELNKMANEQAQLQAQIQLNQTKYDQLQQQIDDTKKKIQDNKDALGQTLVDLYVSGDQSALEMLASSKNISDFVDQQAYQKNLRDDLKGKIATIESLQAQLQESQKKVGQVLADQNAQSQALAAKEAERQQLIDQTRGQEDAYRALTSQKNSQISQLQAQQAAANARFTGGGSYTAGTGPACGGGYPGKWCNIPMDSVGDDWGMFNRECVSYTAFRVAASGRHMPYWGNIPANASNWPANARAAGIPVGSTPHAGDVAIYMGGPYGHAMYVDSVNGNGTINISQYNADFRGTYSTNTISSSGLYFISF